MDTFISFFDANLQKFGGKTAVKDPATGKSLTYGELDTLSRRIAGKLKGRGVQKGDTVAVILPQSIEYIASMLAAMKLGAAFAPLNILYPAERLDYICGDAQVRERITAEFLGDVESCEPVDESDPSSPADPAILIYTSGSTGKPKGVRLSNKALADSLTRLADSTRIGEGDISSLGAPFFFVAGIQSLFIALGWGSTAILISSTVMRDPVKLAETLAEHGVTRAFISPKILRFFKPAHSELRQVTTGSERLSGIYSDSFEIINYYGLSESCGSAMAFTLDRAYDNTPIGAPMGDAAAYILDEEGNEAPEGELCLAGNFADCYVNLPEESAKAFVSNPFADRDGHPMMLRTGDLARRLEDGNIVYLNRRDWMIKINGQRVEPGEIEAVLRKAEGVLEGAVKDFRDGNNSTYLVAYYVAGEEISDDKLRLFLREKLPPYMIPSFFVRLEKLPINANGKLDRGALQAPDVSLLQAEYAAPRTKEEELLCGAFAEVLNVERVGIDDDFFALGGDSIRVAAVMSAARDLPITGADIYTAKTVRKLSELMEGRERKEPENGETAGNAVKAGVKEYPLTTMERGMYLEQSLNPDSVSYNLNIGFIIDGSDPDTIKNAVYRLLRAHESLHSRYGFSEGVYNRILENEVPQVVDGDELMDRRSFEALLEEPGRPFNLEEGIPVRLTLYSLVEGSLGLHMQIHHIAFDGGSVAPFMKEFIANLKGESADEDTPDLYGAYLRTGTGADEDTQALAFYDKMFEGGVPVNEMPVRGTRPKTMPLTDRVITQRMEEGEIDALEKKARQYGVTLFEMVLGVSAAVLGQYCSAEDVVLGIPVNGRDAYCADMIGMFVNTVPVRVNSGRGEKLFDYFSKVAETVRLSTRACSVPFETLVERFRPNRDESRNPLFDMAVNFMPVPGGYDDGLLSVDIISPLQRMSRDMGLVIRRGESSLQLLMQYSSELYDADLMENFLDQIREALRSLAWGEALCVRDLLALPEGQAEQLEGFSCSARADISEALLHRMFEKTAAREGDKTALIACDRTLTFTELNEEANRIAHNLMNRGVKKGDSVVLLLPRRSFYFAAVFGVLKSGAAFIPCDPEYPADRISHIVNDSGASFIITTREHLTDYPEDKTLEIGGLTEGADTENPAVELSGEDLAYMIYTSGSTGRPKGVMLRHVGISNFCTAHPANILYGSEKSDIERMLAVTTVSFDLSLKDTLGMLCNGRTVVFASEAQMNDPRELTRLITEHGVDAMNATPSRYIQYLEYEPFGNALKSCRLVMAGGEAFPKALLDRLQGMEIPFIINTYGPTETTISSNMADLTEAENVCTGRPLLNVKEYILDKEGNMVPRGVTGELYIGGPGVAKGYRNLDEQTAERFVEYRGMRYYRSGDYAKWDAKGNVVILGRMDSQVKLRGLRIEPGEIEEVMEQQSGITRAVVALRTLGDKEQLCAWYTSDGEVDVFALRDALRKKLTAYMVPAAFTRVDAIPMSANGKTDLKALPEPEIIKEEMVSPETEMQQQIFDIASKVVGTGDFGITTELYAVGLTSLNSVSLSIELSEAFDVNVQIRDFREHDTVEKLEKFILSLDQAEALPVLEEYGITKIQEGIFFETQTHPGTTIYNIPDLIVLDETIDTDKLKTAIVAAVAAHPYLKVRFFTGENGETMQRRMDSEAFTEADITELKYHDIDEVMETLVEPFDLLKDRLFRVKLIRTDSKNYLFLDVHHIIYDGTARSILLRDISRAYAGEALTPEKFSGYEAALVEQELRAGEHYDKAKAYYTGLLEGCEVDCMPVPDVMEEKESGSGNETIIIEDEETDVSAIAAFCEAKGIGTNAFYTAAFGYVIAKYCGRDDALFTTVNNGRNDPRFADSISMFVKTYPVLCNTKDRDTLEYLKEVGCQLLDSLTYDIYSFAEMSHELGIRADLIFAYQEAVTGGLKEFCGAPAEHTNLELNEAKAGIEFQVYPKGGKVTYYCHYRNTLYTEGFIRGLIRTYSRVLTELMNRENLELIEPADPEAVKLTEGFNATARDYAVSDIVTLFRSRAAHDPMSTAVIFGNKKISYREADETSEKIGLYLKEKGIGTGDTVSVLIGRCEYMVLASLGVLKTGAAYQPLDPSYPPERLEFMISDAASKLLIADRELMDRLPGFRGEVLYLDQIPELASGGKLTDGPKPEDAFILLYTSGSTGTPKGVVLEHRNLCNFCNWYQRFYNLKKESRVAAYASYGFDACMMDMYPALITGAAVVIIPEEIRLDSKQIQSYFDEHGVTHSFMTTQVGRQFAEFYDGNTLKHLSVGGETLAPVFAEGKSFTFYNVYGPTECTIFTTIFRVNRLYRRVPIGRPLDNLRLYVVDAKGHLLPPGIPGELWVSGCQVGRGYLNQPEKTAEVFIANPFTKEAGYERIYRTGDIVRWTGDGCIDFVGRRDGQVKIRGFRIELTEVENVIREFDKVTDATVQAFDSPSGGKYLAGYLVSDEQLDLDKVRAFIASKKPGYMVPEVLMQIDSIPLNQNQKVNRRALPTSEKKAEKTKSGSEREMTALEKELHEICAEVTGNDDFDVATPLTDAGLTSITTMKLMVLLEKKYGYSPGVSELLKGMSILDIENETVAHYLRAGRDQSPKEEPESEILNAPLTQTQMGVYVECRMEELSDRYNVPFLLKVGPEADVKRMADAIHTAVEAHPSMKCSIEMDENCVTQMVAHPDLEWEVSVEESELDEQKLEAELTRESVVFNFALAPLFRFRIVKNRTAVYLSMTFHHILMDGTSVAVLMEDIEKAYRGETPEKETYDQLKLGLDEKKRLDSDEFKEAARVYGSIFDGVNVVSLPAPEKSADMSIAGKASELSLSLPGVSAAEIADFCSENRVTENALFTGAFALLLARMDGGDEALFASIYNGRTSIETMRIMGMLVKTYPIYVNCDKAAGTVDFVRSVQDRIRELTANDLYSFAQAVHDYDVNADVMFAYQGNTSIGYTLAGQKAAQILWPLEDAKGALSVEVWKKDPEYIARFEYRRDMYTEEQMRIMADIYAMILRGMIKKQKLGDIRLLSEESVAFLDRVNDTDAEVQFRPAHCLMEESAAKYPDRIAVITPTNRITYKELNESANRIAGGLAELGAKGRIVALMLNRDERVYMVRQGILKAGGAFLSIAPEYPEERVKVMAEDSDAAALVVTEEILKEREALLTSLACPVVTVEKLLENEQTGNSDVSVQKDDLAYCIFTSGSTGRPKGVMLTQGNLVNFVDANPKNTEILAQTERGHVSLALAAITFDVSIMEEFIPLSHGMTVCMATEEEIHNPIALAKLMTENDVDVMTCTPSYLTNLISLKVMQEALKKLVTLDLGAEAFPAALHDKLRAINPDVYLVNGYGPTETTISCTMDEVTDPNLITIGRPASNVRAYIMDEQGQVLPPLLSGELIIAGEGVGRGYIGRDDLTQEKFFTVEGRPAYHTGDLAAWTSDGRLRFHGRTDNQVKLRGLRVELGEIESAINAVPDVLTSIVVMVEGEGSAFLVGYYTASREISPEEMRESISRTLTEYMVPGVLMQLDAMPLTANGKIDKKKLPKVEYAGEETRFEEPENETEKFFCRTFSEVLGLEKVSATADFFSVGGSSLTATSVMVKATDEGYDLTYGDVFKYRTPRALAALFAKSREDEPAEQVSTSLIFDKYDYTRINELLKNNDLDSFKAGECRPVGNILLTGATGFMGIHVLEEYLKSEEGKVWCIVRKGKFRSAYDRLKSILYYYFQDLPEEMEARIEVIDGDVTDYGTFEKLEGTPIDTVFNCAANVKHFSAGTDIEDINVGGAENAVRYCLKTGARLIHFSTVSVGGYVMVSNSADLRKLDEQSLYYGQIVNNQYISSKLQAERIVLEAVAEKGADAKVIRVGSLSPRESDGEFQINYLSNSAMGQLRSFAMLKCFPYQLIDMDLRFGPIDASAESFMCLARTPRECCLFHAVNNHVVPLIDVISVMRESGINIELVETAEFVGRLDEAEKDPRKAAILSSILAYRKMGGSATPVSEKCDYTSQVLARMGFLWPKASDSYIRQFINALVGLGFFDEENLFR